MGKDEDEVARVTVGKRPDGSPKFTLNANVLYEADVLRLYEVFKDTMAPIWAERRKAKETEERAASEERFLLRQRVIEVDGVAIRVQGHPSMPHDCQAWYDGFGRESPDCPWMVQVNDLTSNRPWTIEGRVKHISTHWSGDAYVVRAQIPGRAYASIASAVRAARKLEAAGKL